MRVHVSESRSGKAMFADQGEYLGMARECGLGECVEQGQDLLALLEMAQRQLADHERVDCDLAHEQEGLELGGAVTKVLHPDRGVGERHAECVSRRRRGAFSFFSLPPSSARR